MGVWGGASASDENVSKQENVNSSGNTTPIISQQATNAFNAQAGGLNSSGMTPGQQQAYDWQANNLNNNPVNTAIGNASSGVNGMLYTQGRGLNNLNSGVLGGISTGAAPQLSGTPQVAASTSAGAPTGAQAAMAYAPLFSQNLIDPSLKAYDYGTDRAYSALDARTAGAGAFGNTRSGLAYSDLGAQSSLGRGQMESNLLTTGLTNAISAGQTDAAREQGNSQFNANLLTNTSQANANLLQDTAKTNLGATQANTAQQLQAATQIAQNLSTGAGLSQQILNNVVTANGVDMSAAQNLFQAGQISQDQLNQISAAAQQFNGSQFTKNTDTNSNTNTAKFSASLGPG